MKNIAVAMLLFLVGGQIYGQSQKDVTFDRNLFSSDFSEADKSVWPLKNNQYYTFLIQDGKYMLECMGADKKAYLIPKGEPETEALRLEAVMLFQKGSSKEGTAGLAIQLQPGLGSGYLVELNPERQYRISRLQGEGNYKYLTRGKKGWVSAKSIRKPGKENTLLITFKDGRLRLEINNEKVFDRQEDILPAGQNGIFISGLARANFGSYNLYGETPSEDSAGDGNQEVQSKDSVFNSEADALTGDISTLTGSILECKKENQQLKDKNEIVEMELGQNKQKVQELQKFIQENLDLKLQAEVEKLKKENEQQQQELEKLREENASIDDLKKQLQQSKDGNLIIVLSDNLKKEQETNKKLSDQIKSLEWQLKLCKSKSKR